MPPCREIHLLRHARMRKKRIDKVAGVWWGMGESELEVVSKSTAPPIKSPLPIPTISPGYAIYITSHF